MAKFKRTILFSLVLTFPLFLSSQELVLFSNANIGISKTYFEVKESRTKNSSKKGIHLFWNIKAGIGLQLDKTNELESGLEFQTIKFNGKSNAEILGAPNGIIIITGEEVEKLELVSRSFGIPFYLKLNGKYLSLKFGVYSFFIFNTKVAKKSIEENFSVSPPPPIFSFPSTFEINSEKYYDKFNLGAKVAIGYKINSNFEFLLEYYRGFKETYIEQFQDLIEPIRIQTLTLGINVYQ